MSEPEFGIQSFEYLHSNDNYSFYACKVCGAMLNDNWDTENRDRHIAFHEALVTVAKAASYAL